MRMPIAPEPERWVLLVTDGLVIEYAPELFADEIEAEREAERWAWTLSGREGTRVERPFPGRWEIGNHWIRVLPAVMHEEPAEVWVGMYWTRDGSPDPEAVLFGSRDQAKEWAVTPTAGRLLFELHETPWSIAATYKVRDGEETAVANRAKVVV